MSVLPAAHDSDVQALRSAVDPQTRSGGAEPTAESGPSSRNCPECGATGSVFTTFCEVCTTNFGEGAADLPPAVLDVGPDGYRMSDVVAEIRAIGELAAGPATPKELRQACERAEALIRGLRRQFVFEVALGHPHVPGSGRGSG